ncbi:MAG: putative DNA binding domain-containing protein [Clostridiales Family XIII bacterium]|jgi:ATP-dependent DNA helicase RecG|nr:putative DNA binding domain-containing protein [Clostridiales Family XIII bacterium]
MEEAELHRMIHTVQTRRCETQTIEIKAAHQGCPSKLYDTLSAFSNQDAGGVILFGLDERAGFETVGVYDSQDLQHRVAEQCKQMQPAVRPLFTVCDADGKTVVSAEIPGVDVTERPVYYKGVGRIKGSFVRIGEADEAMSDYEIYSFDAYRRRVRDDLRPADPADPSQLDDELLSQYLAALRKNKKNAAKLSDDEALRLMGVIRDGKPTLAGILCFSRYPQAAFPQLCVTAVVVPGLKMGDTGPDHERFTDNSRIEGAIGEMLDDAMLFVERNMRVKTIIDANGKRADKTEYPVAAVREAVLNALMHRDYSIHTEGTPVRILMFNDRLEIRNEGGLYGRLTVDSLGNVHADTRNQTLANILEVMKIAENRYSGIPTIRAEMARHGLPEPVFENRRGNFAVTLKNDYPAPPVSYNWAMPASQALRSANIVSEGNESAAYYYRHEEAYRPSVLREDEYGRDTRDMRDADPGAEVPAYNRVAETTRRYGTSILRPAPVPPARERAEEEALCEREALFRESADIVRFCLRPRTRSEIARFLGKTQYYAMKIFVRPLLADGRLKMTIPDKPKSRRQRYYSE